MLLVGVLDAAVGEHLDLVELVHADDAAGVLAVAAGLAAVAGAPAGVADRTAREVEDLVLVVARQRHLGGSDEVEVVALVEVVHLVGVLAEEAGALHRLGQHQGGGDHRGEPGLRGLVDRGVQDRELELRADAAQEVEAGAGDLRAARHVDRLQALGDLEVILDREVEARDLADGLADDEVLLEPLGRTLGEVRDLAQRGVAGGERLARLALEPLHIGGQLLHLGQQRLLLLALRLRDLLAEGLLLGARGLVGGGGLAPARIGLEHRVDGGLVAPPGPLGRSDDVGILAQEPQIDHCSRVPARAGTPASSLGGWI